VCGKVRAPRSLHMFSCLNGAAICEERSEKRGEERRDEQKVVNYCAMQYKVVRSYLAFPSQLLNLLRRHILALSADFDGN